MDFMITGKQVT